MDTSMAVVNDWGTAIMVALTRALGDFMAFIPKLLGALLLLLVG